MGALQQGLLLGAEALLVGTLILVLFHLRRRAGLSPLYIAVGTFQYLTAVLSLSITLELWPGFVISPGPAILLTATLFAILLVYIHEDAEEARLLVYGLAIANVALALLSNLFGLHLESPLVQNHLALPRELLFQDLRPMAVGSVLLIFDGLLLIISFEAVGRLVSRSYFLRSWLAFVPVLTFDSLAFVVGTSAGNDQFLAILSASILGKLFAATLFSALLAIYLTRSKAASLSQGTGPLHPGDAFRMLTFRQKYQQLRKTQDAVEEVTGRLNLALSAARVGTWDWYPNEDRLVWDEHMFPLFGVDPERFTGTSRHFFEAVHPEDRDRLVAELESAHQQAPVDTTYRVPLPNGEIRYICDRARPYRDPKGGVERMIGVCWDVTDQKRAEEELARVTEQLKQSNVQLEDQALRDPLTGLFNRRGLGTVIRRELKRATENGSSSIAILADCDNFKAINDTHGYHVGDSVLIGIGKALQSCLRRRDVLGRIGGDEFLIFLPETELAEAEAIAEAVRVAVTATAPPGFNDTPTTISLGIAGLPNQSLSLREVVQETQGALKRSKAAGKDRVSAEYSR